MAIPSGFETLKSQIDQNKTDPLSVAIEKATKGLSKADYLSFNTWYLEQRRKATMIGIAAQVKKTPTTSTGYTDALAKTDFSSISSISTFRTAAFGSDTYNQPPSPVFLGIDSSHRYFLQPSVDVLEATPAASDKVDVHPYLAKMVSAGTTKPVFQYGFGLGQLVASPTSMATSSTSPAVYSKTPFCLYLDVISGGIWAILKPNQSTEMDREIIVSPAKVWEFMPTQQTGRKGFDTLRISDVRSLGRIDSRNAIFSDAALKSASVLEMRASAVDAEEVAAAIRNASSRAGA